MCIAVVEINRRKRYEGRLGSDGIKFLLFGHDPAHPEFEITDVLWDISQLGPHLELFGMAVNFCCVLGELPSEANVGTGNRTSFAHEIDRGRCCHTQLGDEVGANDGGASTDAHDTMNLLFSGRRIWMSVAALSTERKTHQNFVLGVALECLSDEGGGVVEMRDDSLPETI